MVEHVNIPNSDLHEPKDVSSASAGEVYVADGSSSGAWENYNPYGGWRYSNIGTGTTYTAPTAYTLMNVAGVTTHLSDFTNNSLGRLTYTGAPDRHCYVILETSFKHSTGSGTDVYFEWYINGVAQSSIMVKAADSVTYQHITLHFDKVFSTNDYVEVFLKTASGDVVIHTAYMFIAGMPS